MVQTTDWRAALCDVGPFLIKGRAVPKPDTEYELKFELECLRLATDLAELAKHDLDADLKAHCLRMARWWSEQAEKLSSPRPALLSTDDPTFGS